MGSTNRTGNLVLLGKRTDKGFIMTKGLLLLLILTFNTNRMGSKYLLVQLEDASDEEIKATAGLAGTLVGTAALVAAGGAAAIPAIGVAATGHAVANVLQQDPIDIRLASTLGKPCYHGWQEGHQETGKRVPCTKDQTCEFSAGHGDWVCQAIGSPWPARTTTPRSWFAYEFTTAPRLPKIGVVNGKCTKED